MAVKQIVIVKNILYAGGHGVRCFDIDNGAKCMGRIPLPLFTRKTHATLSFTKLRKNQDLQCQGGPLKEMLKALMLYVRSLLGTIT